jgi:peptide/nickel transport system permease protein
MVLGRFILKRLGLALITLWLLSVIVFVLGQVLPSDPGRSILGPLAAPSAVHALDHQLGVDKPILTQYWHWISNFPGTSYQYQAPIGPILTSALGRSLKLAIFAFIILVPLGILGGVISALNAGKPIDRTISVVGQTMLTVPEFVSGIVLIVVFAVALGWLPVTATAPPGSGFFTQLKYLILPVIPLVMVLFGYIARMARVGTIEALESDYARTATLKGLPRGVMIRRHVLRNSLLPTITVIATQTGYLIGGLVVVETLFRYQGIGSLTYNAATQHDIPMLEACVLTIGVVYMLVTLLADIGFSVLNPRIRLKAAE